jgi:hypothetical protein
MKEKHRLLSTEDSELTKDLYYLLGHISLSWPMRNLHNATAESWKKQKGNRAIDPPTPEIRTTTKKGTIHAL